MKKNIDEQLNEQASKEEYKRHLKSVSKGTIKLSKKYWFSITDTGIHICTGSHPDTTTLCTLNGSNENAALAHILCDALNGDQSIQFAKWIISERYNWDWDKCRYVAAWNNYSEHTAHELFKIFHKERY